MRPQVKLHNKERKEKKIIMTPDQLKKLKQEAKNFNYEGALKSAVTNYKTAVSYYKNQKK